MENSISRKRICKNLEDSDKLLSDLSISKISEDLRVSSDSSELISSDSSDSSDYDSNIFVSVSPKKSLIVIDIKIDGNER